METFRKFLFIILLAVVVYGCIVPAAAAGTQTPLTFSTSQHTYPALDGDWAAWEDFDGAVSAIHAYNIVTGVEFVLPHSSDFSYSPFIQGDRIVWLEDNTSGYKDLYWSDLPPVTAHYVPAPESMKGSPSLYGNKIVWHDNAYGNNKVLMYDISNGEIYDLAPDAPADTDQQYPRIFGDLVVWQDGRNYADWDIWMNNTDPAYWEEKQVVLDPANQSYFQELPAVYGNMIVYQDDRAGVPDIYLYDAATDTELGNITPDDDGLDQRSPEISGTTIAWLDSNGIVPGDSRIGMFDRASGTEYLPPVPDATQPAAIKIAGNRLVWSETRSGTPQIYLYTEGIVRECPIPDFTADPVSGSPGLVVSFTDQSAEPADNLITHRFWDFADGKTSVLQNPSNTFALAGVYPVSLTVGNPLCRNATPMEDRYNITIGPPTARFTATPRTGLIPMTVVVTDTSTGSPDEWNWSFGDGSYADTRTASHTYLSKGIFTIRLNVSNSYGTSTATTTILAMKGMNGTAYTDISGLTFQNTGGRQEVNLDYSVLPYWTFLPNTSVLEFTPPEDRGWTNITLYSFDGIGFVQDPATHTVRGNVTGATLETREILLDALSAEIGPESTFYYILDHSRYPVSATLQTQIWQGMTSADFLTFTNIASHTGYGHLSGTAYTVKVTKTNIPDGVSARLYMSANASWIEHLADWRNLTAVPRISDDGTTGEMLPAVFLSNDPVKNLDYFEVPSPHGICTFGLSQTTESGNPLQLITLTVTSHVNDATQQNEPSDSETGGGGGGKGAAQGVAVTTTTPAPTPTPAPADPGKSAKVYTNPQGVVSQETKLLSTDGRATILLKNGVVAKDAAGKPLTEITIKATPAAELPAVPSGSAFTFAGMAYGTGPDGATFSPPLTLTFAIPQAQWGEDYVVRSFDRQSGTWQSLPTTFDAATGVVTVQVSHFCCIALFTESRASSKTPAPTPPPGRVVPQVTAQPPASAVSIFMSMLGWAAGLILNNLIILAAIIILVIAAILVMRGRSPGWGR